ncbi:YhdP family protein [Pollutimonas sp. H1-120]|uniref:YhdP family protein n=1 Tax=Pollutimonas sp. H1-120 TaxID=3148824 RepID=UPI003B528C61
MFRLSTAILGILGKIALLIYFLLAAGFLGIRYWVLPNIDDWRPQISQALSSALDTDVSLGKIKAEWTGLNPRIEISDVVFTGHQRQMLLTLPRLRAVLSWRSVFSLAPLFVSLDARGIDLDIRRSRDGRLHLLGRSFDMESIDASIEGESGKFVDWLAVQRQIVLREATIRWTDETRHASALVLNGVTLNVVNQGRDHRFSLAAVPPSQLGESLDVRGTFRQAAAVPIGEFTPAGGTGQLYARVEDMRPLGWSPWVDLPQSLKSGRLSAQGWLRFGAGKIQHFTSDVSVSHGRWDFGDQAQVQAGFVRLYLAGPWKGHERLFGPGQRETTEPGAADSMLAISPVIEPPLFDSSAAMPSAADAPPLEFRLQARELDVLAPGIFEYPLDFEHIGARGSVQDLASGRVSVQAEQADVANKDMEARLQGGWRQGGDGPPGLVDLRGHFKRALITAIDEYLPNTVNLDAREWMAKGLVNGQIEDAELVLRGDLEYFPFNEDPSKGDFSVQGKYTGGIIDYLPPEGKTLGWPRLTDMRGSVALNRADLRLVADQATMWPTTGLPIQLKNVQAHIPNIEENSVLGIQGETTAKGEAYLALMTHSPLGELLDGIFDEASADGVWEVPLSLSIPLLHSRESTVQGAIRFSGSTLRLMPEMPPFQKLTGTMDFTDSTISTSDLKAEFLGGTVSAGGGVGGGLKGLQLQGRATDKALTGFVGVEGMKRLAGSVSYKATLRRGKDRNFMLSAHSDLKGLALDLPAPLGKPAEQALPLQVDWQRHTDRKSMALNVMLGDQVQARLLHRENQKGGSYFYAGTVGVNKKPNLPAAGMSLDILYPSVDIDAWQDIATEFSTSISKSAKSRDRPLLPDIGELRLQAKQADVQGLTLDELTFTARRPESAQWRVDISSSQTAGTLFWREAKGRIAGRIDANFDRLSLGRDKSRGEAKTDDDKDDFQVDDDLDIPGVNLHVKNLRLYGRDVGELSVVGVNQERGRLWRLDELKLSSSSAVLEGNGMWRLSGPRRGLKLDAHMDAGDLGAYFDQIGFKDVMKGGAGTVRGSFEWRNMPWDFSKADLNGNVEFKLEKGRFITLNSYSARLLELLSLQSVKRLARLDFNPAGLTKEGFPYDDLRGTVVLKDGLMSTSDYRVIGPVGTIVLGGDVNLLNDTLDLQAVVIPNLDVSGAAIAAGIAINPIVGIGAFLTQWFLQAPLAKAMTVEYRISGNWDEPQIKEVAAPPRTDSKQRSITP